MVNWWLLQNSFLFRCHGARGSGKQIDWEVFVSSGICLMFSGIPQAKGKRHTWKFASFIDWKWRKSANWHGVSFLRNLWRHLGIVRCSQPFLYIVCSQCNELLWLSQHLKFARATAPNLEKLAHTEVLCIISILHFEASHRKLASNKHVYSNTAMI